MRPSRITPGGVALLAVAASIDGGVRAQTPSVPNDVVIKLERTSCFGECPVYSVTIDGRGNVVYDGTRFVRVEGRQTARILISRVAAILETVDHIGFFDLRDQYRVIRNPDGTETTVTDLPTTFVTITREGRSKRVEDYIGAPEELKQLERQIDDAARTKRWISLDAETLEQLVREGWRPSPDERAELLRKALGQDEVGVIKGLLDLGADPNGTYFGLRNPPLMMVRSAAAARLLLDAGADPFARSGSGLTALYRSVYLAPDVAALLLKAGVRADDPADSEGRTALWLAACGGNGGVVSVLLAAGANPAVAASGKSALDCAKQAREAERSRRPLVQFGKPPFVKDFDHVIAALEQALAKRGRR